MTLKQRIKELCKKKDITLVQFEKDLEFGKGYTTKFDKVTPKMDTLQKIAEYFDVSVDYLIRGDESYYIDEDGRRAAEILFKNPEYKVLFDAVRKTKKEDIEAVKSMIDAYNNRAQ